MAGGPNLCPPDAPGLEQVFALVLSSWLAFGPSRARYAKVGRPRPSSEKELILCNLVARRQPLLDLGGFNEALYPNEENALMDELQKRGGVLLYDPEIAVFRRPRSSLKAFAKMLLTYGRGRAEQFRLHPTPGSALNFVPPLFCLYLVIAPFLGRVGWFPCVLPFGRGGAGMVLIPTGGCPALAATPLVVLRICFTVWAFGAACSQGWRRRVKGGRSQSRSKGWRGHHEESGVVQGHSGLPGPGAGQADA
jgi:hypothetical protein